MSFTFPGKKPSHASPDLFSAQHERRPEHYLIAHTDGGSRGNPGPAGYGVFLTDEKGNKVAALSEYLGHQTNNVAEYRGLLAALEYAVGNGPKALQVVSDSELLVRQMKGIYKVRNADLRNLYDQAHKLIAKLEWFLIGHVLREQNREADLLANAAMDRKSAGTVGVARMPSEEFSGVVRNGVVELMDGTLPDGTRVQVRVKR